MEKEFNYSQKDNKWYPTIDVILQGHVRGRAFRALVDSGASISIFRGEVADYLGILLEKGKPTYLTGVGGRILGYLHKIPVEIENKKFNCKIIFSREYTVSFNILGRDNFFLPFLITFNEKMRKLKIIDY
ncbi:MAG: retropepsin-like aspartic protease [Patescibacteria group bacterium]